MFTKIITHAHPHLDEIVPIWCLMKWGRQKYPGIEKAVIAYWSDGGNTPDGRTAEEYEQEGILLVGVGGGKYDEHPRNGRPGKLDESTATLVAKDLGIAHLPALQEILDFTKRTDLGPAEHPFDLSAMVKVMHRMYPKDPEEVIRWTVKVLEAKYKQQKEFHTIAMAEFRKAEIEEIPGPYGKMIRLAIIHSDHDLVGKVARSWWGGYCSIMIQKRSTGNVQIFVNQKHGLSLREVARLLRIAEQYHNERHHKQMVVTTDWRTLESEGNVAGAEAWYYHEKGEFLMNGSLSHSDVPATALSLGAIREAVLMAMDQNEFDDFRADECRKGNCTSTPENSCSWYSLGLYRCRNIRRGQYQAVGRLPIVQDESSPTP